jgi:hypothetical protein
MSLAFTSFTFDQAQYSPGQTITLTAAYTSTDPAEASSVASAVTVVLSDAASGTVTQTSDGSPAFPDFTTSVSADSAQPTTVSATDSRSTPGVWTLVSNSFTGTAAPFTGTAVLTSTA